MTRLALVPKRERSPGSSRYELLVKIASGATATVYVARLTGAPGSGEDLASTTLAFSRLVAVKRAHPHLVDDLAARQTLLGEARLASRIHHANVVAVQDVDETEDDLLLVMEYVEGGSLAELLEASSARSERVPPAVAVKIALDACAGLAAVHELCDDDGRPLGLVHRDVSPQNVLVGVDGTARITDFGLARLAPSANASRTTGAVQGKIAYVSPEYVEGATFDVKSEVFALGVVVWEALANRRLFRGANEADTLRRVLSAPAPLLSQVAPHLGPHLDAAVSKALEKHPSKRHETVRAFAEAIERAARKHDLMGTSTEVGAWVRACVGPALEQRRTLLRASVAPVSGGGDASFGDTVSMLHTDVLAQLATHPHGGDTPHPGFDGDGPGGESKAEPAEPEPSSPPAVVAPRKPVLSDDARREDFAVAEDQATLRRPLESRPGSLPPPPPAALPPPPRASLPSLPPPAPPARPSRPSHPDAPTSVPAGAPSIAAAPVSWNPPAPVPAEPLDELPPALPIASRTPLWITAAAFVACALMAWVSSMTAAPTPAVPPPAPPDSAAPPAATEAGPTPEPPTTRSAPPIPVIMATALPAAPTTPTTPKRPAAAGKQGSSRVGPPPPPVEADPASPVKPPPNPYKRKP